MFVTDGMLERDAAGIDIAAILTEGADMHPREAVQHLTHAVLQASGGRLQDDATALCLDWHGGRPRDRDASSGANREVRADPGTAAARSPQPGFEETQADADPTGAPVGGAVGR
jgi:hypothetical protein